MGIPAFYRWLVDKYPLIVAEAKEGAEEVKDDRNCQINPNGGVGFDNLYLDMNGIIHPCFHPERQPAPTTYQEVFSAVFSYIDRIFSIVRPRKLLYLAIDGVAPRAKMNQQRSRRFRAAKDAADEQARLSSDRPEKEKPKLDSNVITPGTKFMDLLSSALQYYIRLRMNEDLRWRGIKVILSDASVAGEGEHKIMSYIRLQRNLPGFDPNTRHCLYGLDADLIMLALATHEIHFSILREDIGNASIHNKTLKNKNTLMKQRNINGDSEKVGTFAENLKDHISGLKFQFVNIWVLREYLAYDMRIPEAALKVDLERIIDDFVFMCLFVGNDFLPHIPSLEISEGAIDLLMMVYKKEFVPMGGYLTNSFEVNLTRMEHFVQALGSHESAIFRKRNQIHKEREIRSQCFTGRKHGFNSSKLLFDDAGISSFQSYLKPETTPLCQDGQNPRSMEVQGSINCTVGVSGAEVGKIKLGEEGWKERFYAEKFGAKMEDECHSIRRHAVSKYIEGICWVMRYYYEGVCSWQWFYPYHYAPFASDFYGCGQLEIHFTLGEPFKPFDQLMGVLPAASAHALPLFYRKLMTDASSPILDFYPTDFELDMNGKRFSWQAICKLPFIEEARLLLEIEKVEHTLTVEERRRNCLGLDILFMHISHPLAIMIISLSEFNDHSNLPKANAKQEIDPKVSGGMNGYIYISDKPEQPLEISSAIDAMHMVNNQVISVLYEYPPFHSHIPRLPEGLVMPSKSVTKWDISHGHRLWHETAVSARVFSKRPIPKSVSGPYLAKLARQLVSVCNPSKHEDMYKCVEPDFLMDTMNEKTEPKFEKRKSKKRKRRSKNSNQSGGDGVADGNAEKLDSHNVADKLQCHIQEERKANVHADGDGAMEIKVKGKSKKREQRSKEKRQFENDGNLINSVKKLESCAAREQREGDSTHVNADGLEATRIPIPSNNCQGQGNHNHSVEIKPEGGDGEVEIKTEEKSKERKRRSKKKRQIEDDGSLINSIEKLESCAAREQREGDGNNVNADGLGVTRIPIPSYNFLGEGNHHHSVEMEPEGRDWGVEIKTAEKSKERKRRSEKKRWIEDDGSLINSVEKLESCAAREQREGDSNNTNADGLEATRIPIPSDNCLGEGNRHHLVEIKPEGRDVGVEIETEEKSKKRKRRSKKKIQIEVDGSLINSVEKLESSAAKEQREGDSNHVNADGLEATRIPVPHDNSLGEGNRHQSVGIKPEGGERGVEIKTEEKSKRRKRRSKKIQIEDDGSLINSVEKLESCVAMEQRQGDDSNHVNVDGLEATRSPVLDNSVEKLGSCGFSKQHEGDSNHLNADGLEVIRFPIPNNSCLGKGNHDHSGAEELETKPEGGDGGVEIKMEEKSKKRKQRSKKKRRIDDVNSLTNSVEKLESCAAVEPRDSDDSNHVNADGLEAKRSPVANNRVEKLKSFSARDLREGDGSHVNAFRMVATISSVPDNNCQREGNPDHIVANREEIKLVVKSKRKKRRSKEKKQKEVSCPL